MFVDISTRLDTKRTFKLCPNWLPQVNRWNCRAVGGSIVIADGSQQMLLLLNTICVILHHILQHLTHQHFAVF